MKIVRSSVQRISKEVSFEFRTTSAGSVEVVAVGSGKRAAILRILGGDQRKSGQIVRLKNVPPELGLVLTDEGRAAVAEAN